METLSLNLNETSRGISTRIHYEFIPDATVQLLLRHKTQINLMNEEKGKISHQRELLNQLSEWNSFPHSLQLLPSLSFIRRHTFWAVSQHCRRIVKLEPQDRVFATKGGLLTIFSSAKDTPLLHLFWFPGKRRK